MPGLLVSSPAGGTEAVWMRSTDSVGPVHGVCTGVGRSTMGVPQRLPGPGRTLSITGGMQMEAGGLVGFSRSFLVGQELENLAG